MLLNRTAVRHAAREVTRQTMFLFIGGIELVALLFLLFGFDLQKEDGIVVAIRLFGGTFPVGAQAAIDTFIGAMFNLMTGILMFLLILIASSFSSELLRNPLVGIILTKPVSRRALFISRFSGLVGIVTSNIVVFGLFLALILNAESEGSTSFVLLSCALSFSLEFVVMLTLCSFLAMLADQPLVTSAIAIAFYYLVGPLIAEAQGTSGIFVWISSVLLPPIGNLSSSTRAIVFGKSVEAGAYLAVLPHSAIFLAISVFLFHRKDLT